MQKFNYSIFEKQLIDNLSKLLIRIIPGNPKPFLSINTLLEPYNTLSFGEGEYFYQFNTKIYLNPNYKSYIIFETEKITIPDQE